jgi:RHS repeat-associated protein
VISTTGAETDFTYNSSGQVTEVDQHNTTSGSPGTSTTRFDYTSATQTLVATPDTSTGVSVPSGPHLTYTISATHQVTAAVNQDGDEVDTSYTGSANTLPTSQTTAVGTASAGTTALTWGANSNQSLTSVAAPGGATNSAAYSNTLPPSVYLPSSTTDSANNQTKLTYTAQGNPQTSSTTATPSGPAATASLSYNSNGTVATATAPLNATSGNDTAYAYYSDDQLKTITPPTGTSLGVRTLTYDPFGRLSTITDGAGNTTTYTYDNDDRVLTEAFSDGTHTVTNTYDAAGRLLTQVSASGTITNTYDQLGHLMSTVNTAGGGTESYTYDAAGNLLTTTDGFGTTTNTYDAAGYLQQTKYPHFSAGSGVYEYVNFSTNAQGLRTDEYLQSTSNWANRATSWAGHIQYTYDSSKRVTEVLAQTGPESGPTTVFDTSYCFEHGTTAPTCTASTANDQDYLQWSYDHLTGQATAYGYDGAGRLLSVAQSGGSGVTDNTYGYTYDADGNRLTSSLNGTTVQSLTYNAANQITSTGYSYDGAGNLTTEPAATGSGSATYTYNAAEQMTKSVVDAVTTTYTYAGASQNAMLSSTSSSHTTGIVYGRTDANGNPEIEQYNYNTNQAYILDDPVTGQPNMLVTSADQDCALVFDGLNNPVALLTDFSTNSFSYSYDPWGVQTLNSGGTGNGAAQNPYAFHQGIKDVTSGLVHFGTRWYDPTTGTWTQQDTLDSPLDPANANRYAYAGDDPINASDPTGASSLDCEVLGGIGGVAGLVAGGAGVYAWATSPADVAGAPVVNTAAAVTVAVVAGAVSGLATFTAWIEGCD